MFNLIMAVGQNGEVGMTGNKFGLPWGSIPEDMAHFRNLTTNQVVVMGSNTYALTGPLANRGNIVCSRDPSQKFERAKTMSLEQIRQLALTYHRGAGDIFVIGGPTLATYLRTFYDLVYITRIHGSFEADTYMNLKDVLCNRKLIDSKLRECKVSGYILEIEIYK